MRGRKLIPLEEKLCVYCKKPLVIKEGEQRGNFRKKRCYDECKLPYMRQERVGHFAIKSGDYFTNKNIWEAFNLGGSK